MHLPHVQRSRILMRDLQSAFSPPMALAHPRRRLHTTASTPSLRAPEPGFELAADEPGPDNESSNVRVVVRVRGFVPREINREAECLVRMDPVNQTATLAVPDRDDSKTFAFDRCYWSHDSADPHYASQQHVFDDLGRDFLDHSFAGFHTCILAYGQTGAGKSHTMLGTAADSGLIPRLCRELFGRIEAASATAQTTYVVHVSYLEIYNEHVRDLLTTHTAPAPSLRIRESPTDGVFVQGLTDLPVRSYSEIEALLARGDRNRVTAATKLNPASSRSHAVFTLTLRQITHSLSSDETVARTSRIRLVDLAGSERASATATSGLRLTEGANINRSLSTLGRVISALAAPPASRTLIPFRDSVLTWLLRDSLGGNSKTAMVACIGPADYEETLSTLRYAAQAKQIRLRARPNVDAVSAADRDAQLAAMAATIDELRHTVAESVQADASVEKAAFAEYQNTVSDLQRLMDEAQTVADARVRGLSGQLVELKSANSRLQDEAEALRRHVKLVMLELQTPIMLPPMDSELQPADHPKSDAEEDDQDSEKDGSETEEWAAEVTEMTDSFLNELSLFRRKLGDDHQRFGLDLSTGPQAALVQ